MDFLIKKFNALSLHELYLIYQLRAAVFVVEQKCAYQDPDEMDPNAYHVMIMNDTKLVGYARIIPPGIIYKESSIGRVVVAEKYRGRDSGKSLMRLCIQRALELFHDRDIVISAQIYLLRFYTDLNFCAEGEAYLEDKIPHIKMRFKAPLPGN